VALALSVTHFHARTQIFGDALMVVWVAEVVRAVDTKSSPRLMLLPIMTLWANVHGSFVAGLALTVALALEAAFESPGGERLHVVRRWAVFIIAAVSMACLTPYGARAFSIAFQVIGTNEIKPYAAEWQPVSFQTAPIPFFAVLGCMFLALLNGAKIRFCRLAILLLIAAYMLTAVRFIFLFNTIAPLLLATPLASQFRYLRISEHVASQPQLFMRLSQVSSGARYGICGIVAIAVLTKGIFGNPVEPPRSRQISAEGSVDYIFDHNLHGKIYNGFNFGGYLILRGIPTFIDGRTDQLFGDGFTTENRTIVTERPREFIGYLDKYHISVGLVAPNSMEAQEFRASSDWIGVYADDVSELFVKRTDMGPAPS
jgi:hypothetical protein